MPRHKDTLTRRERIFVQFYEGPGTGTEAAKTAGYKQPRIAAQKLLQKPRVLKAIEQKQNAMLNKLGRDKAKGVSVNRNDIINRLDKISTDAESDSARVAALGHLVGIFGLSAGKKDGTDIFAGWSKEELDHYALTGELPDRVRSGIPPSESQTSG